MNIYLNNNTPSNFVVNGNSSIVKSPVKLYTNLADEVGYSDNKRISTSDATSLRDQTGYMTTNTMLKIPANSTIRTRGINFIHEQYEWAYITVLRVNNTLMNYANTSLQNLAAINSVVTTEEGDLIITTNAELSMRFCGYGKGQDFIITIDEEIVEWPYDILSNPLKDWVPYSTTEPGGIERFNDIGWKENCRWSNSGQAISDALGTRVTGWIPYVRNAVAYCYNFLSADINRYYAGITVGSKDGVTLDQTCMIFDGTNSSLLEYDEANAFIKLKLNWGTNDYDYWRISANNRTDETNILTEPPRIYMRYE